MPTLYIEEFRVPKRSTGKFQLQLADKPLSNQKVTVSTVNTYAVPMSASTKLVRLCTDTPAQWLVAGSSTAATSTARFLPANSPEYFYVNPSDVLGVIKQV